MSPIVITLSLPDWFVERLGNPDSATLERQVLEALVADCLRAGRASKEQARLWLGLDAPGTLEAFCKVNGITGEDAAAGDGA